MKNSLKVLQEQLDIEKYIASNEAGVDLCGKLTYCKYCNKKNKYPCASAKRKLDKEAA